MHTICYSILLLNTDLHIADIDQKMTRTQFIKNTMPTIRRVVADAAPGAFDMARGSMLPPPRAKTDGPEPLSPSFKTNTLPVTAREDYDGRRPLNRLSARPSDWSGSDNISLHDAPPDECGPLVKTPFNGKMNSWEALVEVVLRDFYNSIRQERLPLQGMEEPNPAPENCGNSITGVAGGMLRRTNSLLSRTGSETVPVRGRGMAGDGRLGNRWASKNRSRPRMYPASLAHSRTSFDDDMSVNSPSASSMWSKYSFGKTQTSMSVHSFSSDFPQGDYQQSIGFANALSQAIIREEATSDGEHETMRVGPLLEDESLELHGAPWAKEGTLKHKHHLEAVDKRAKDRAWIECFAVIEKGWMRLFQFNQKSMRSKNRMQKSGGVVGGGNWFENAQPLGQYMLRHSIASALPPPGYSKARPHVWALSLPTGAVHLFQAGTPEIVKEYVSSANYWSARLSKEPLVGAVSNIEYGWSENIINLALVADRDNGNPTQNRPPSAMHHARPSLQNSIRSSLDQGNSRPRLPGDRVIISDWTPPTQSMMASQLLEVDQLRALSTYVKNVEEELKKHNEFRSAMLLAVSSLINVSYIKAKQWLQFTPRLPNYNKAMVNWERKSSYLLREIVKFTTYIDCLQTANIAKNTIYTEQAEREKMKEELQRERIEQEQGTSGDKGIEATRSGPAPVAAT